MAPKRRSSSASVGACPPQNMPSVTIGPSGNQRRGSRKGDQANALPLHQATPPLKNMTATTPSMNNSRGVSGLFDRGGRAQPWRRKKPMAPQRVDEESAITLAGHAPLPSRGTQHANARCSSIQAIDGSPALCSARTAEVVSSAGSDPDGTSRKTDSAARRQEDAADLKEIVAPRIIPARGREKALVMLARCFGAA